MRQERLQINQLSKFRSQKLGSKMTAKGFRCQVYLVWIKGKMI